MFINPLCEFMPMKQSKVAAKTAVFTARRRDGGGLFVAAGVLLGIGLGLAWGNPGAGVLIGLGAGFLVWAVLRAVRR